MRGIAADLGISRHSLNDWVRAQTATADTTTAAATADAVTDAAAGGVSRSGRTGPTRGRGLAPEDELAALRARVAALETEKDELVAEQVKLVTERDILRQAAKYFAGETIW